MAKLISENPELLLYLDGKLHLTVLGGIKLTGLDRLKVTLKIRKASPTGGGLEGAAYRHNLDLYNGIQTEQLIEKASETLDVSTSETSQVISRLITELENYRATRLEEMKPKQPEKRELSETERKQAINFLKSPNLLGRTKEAIKLSGLIGEETNSMIAYLTYTSRKRHVPLHLMCLGASGTGKTWLQEKVSELMPEEDKLEITTLSSNAFYYFGREELKHKLLLIEDLDGAESVLYPLRELQSKRKISKTVTLKDNKGNLKTVTLNVEGPVCVSGCTTREQLYEDNANRCILLYMDNSTEQDRNIMDYQRKLSAGKVDQAEEQQIRNQIKNVQRLLKPITVKNPYATFLQLPEAVFKPRRTMLLLLLFTETITYYHQYQRILKTDTDTGEQYIESTIEDVENAFTLLENTILKKSDELNDACRGFFEKLKAYLKEQDTEAFYAKEVRSVFRLSPSSLKRYLFELERMGYIKIVRGNRYKGFEYKINNWNDLESLQNDSQNMVKTILENIKSVARSSVVAQSANGLHNGQKTSKKVVVAQEK
ncbi:hypothetical protein HDC90_004539 [Pedobacter sp. AK013]|uniref:hypothetical protein n=1 Tax=Pedobacter sp. AK013 TaxID=2723071 RepID=UPI00161A82A1|nr:hypothetical protein [Pedobacter sp. AK013]MBB6239877.1 hypothetical protein [Pedobacter sp. AK013]